MSVTLANDLIYVPLREKSATGDRYEYQALWGLALLFKEHTSSEDYAIIFEFHDDIALLDHSISPTKVRFYQIKSKDTSGGWTLSALLHREKVRTKKGTTITPSHIDKMYDNIHKFSSFVLSVDFVSNQMCGFKTDKKSFRFSECTSDHFKK
ncbi:dsDNA nuclease domain-containing protein [Methylobacterium sp. EM32]|uniref:dsDNA nuclease domain-containing protein n=1 Tax=Methylobacterium sp. EM32 TaxID=3163481 RepID=UPI0033AAB57B